MKAKTVTREYILCPNCGKSEHQVDQVEIGRTFGPWYCDEDDCGRSWTGVRTSDGAELTFVETNKRTVFIELRYCDDPKLKIVVSGMEFLNSITLPGAVGGGTTDPIVYPDHHEYYYNEHTCPTNYLGVEEVRYGDDYDPHGVFEFVRVLTEEERQQVIVR